LPRKHQQNAVFGNLLMFFISNCPHPAQETSAKRRFWQFADVFHKQLPSSSPENISKTPFLGSSSNLVGKNLISAKC